MKLKVIAQPTLTLLKEDITYTYGEIFEVSEERGSEILKTTYNGRPVVEYVLSDSNKEIEEKEREIERLNSENNGLISKVEELEAKINELTKESEKLLEELTLPEDDQEQTENIEKEKKNNKNKREEK